VNHRAWPEQIRQHAADLRQRLGLAAQGLDDAELFATMARSFVALGDLVSPGKNAEESFTEDQIREIFKFNADNVRSERPK
jgi:hypothetical protein